MSRKNSKNDFHPGESWEFLTWITWSAWNETRKLYCFLSGPVIHPSPTKIICPTPDHFLISVFSYSIMYNRNERDVEASCCRLETSFLGARFLTQSRRRSPSAQFIATRLVYANKTYIIALYCQMWERKSKISVWRPGFPNTSLLLEPGCWVFPRSVWTAGLLQPMLYLWSEIVRTKLMISILKRQLNWKGV